MNPWTLGFVVGLALGLIWAIAMGRYTRRLRREAEGLLRDARTERQMREAKHLFRWRHER